MSSSFADFVTAWNESMPVHIRESDIKNPTEQTFRLLLIATLRTLMVDVTGYENMDCEGGNVLRASRVRLIATANYFYKIANPDVKKRHDLVFMDLIQPSFKKVFNTLNYLMNYSVYVRHRYKETVLDLNEKLQERDDLLTKKNQLRMAIEEGKIKMEKNIREIRDLDNKLPRQKAKNVDLEEQQKKLKYHIAKLNDESEKIEMDFVEIQGELETVKNSAMSDAEIEGIRIAKENALQRLEEQNHYISAVRSKLKENSQAIEEAQGITNQMEALTLSFNINPAEIRSKRNELEEITARISKLKTDITKNQAELVSISHAMIVKKNDLELDEQKFELAHTAFDMKDIEQAKELKEADNLLRQLKVQESTLAAQYNRLRKEQANLLHIASNVIKHISNKMMDDEDTEN